MHKKFWQGSLKERDYFEDLGVDGTIILKRILKTWNVGEWIGFILLRVGTGATFLNTAMKLPFLKLDEFLDHARKPQLLKSGCAPWRQSVDLNT